jgi:selenocysteine-specific elongation factor
MYVVATAGHVDHGKSTLLRALTGMEPDRWAEERERGMTIDLGYVWMTLPSGARLAFVDVPGHERFVGNMLAGVGPVPAVLFVVAADEGWMPQSAEHLAALDALGVRHGLLAITRGDLGDAELAEAEAREYLRGTSLAGMEAVAVSAVTGAGLEDVRSALDRLVAQLPPPQTGAPVRLWIDRVFGIRGSGTVVTGTLGAGTLRVGDELQVDAGETVRVRGLQALQERRDEVSAVARVAVNVRTTGRVALQRGAALVTPGRWQLTDTVDAWLDMSAPPDKVDAGTRDEAGAGGPPAAATVHIGSARVPARLRVLGASVPRYVVRLALSTPLPLHVGDLALLRDASRARGARVLGRVTVLDVRPPRLNRRGAAAQRGRMLAALSTVPDGAELLRQRGVVRRPDLIAMGGTPPVPALVADWLVDPEHAGRLRHELVQVVGRYAAAHPLEPGVPLEAARHTLGLPDRRIVEALVRSPLRLSDGRIEDERRAEGLPAALVEALARVRAELTAHPFHAPEQERLTALGLDRRAVAVAARHGLLLRIADGVVLLPHADQQAVRILATLPQPFTASAAREALDTTRRVVIPLLEYLDRCGATERVDETHRRCRVQPGTAADGQTARIAPS